MRTLRRIAVVFCIAFGVWIPLAWISAEYLIVENPLESADAILVLSGSAEYVERTHEAAALFKNGIAPKIFLTHDGLQGSWNRQEQRNPYFSERARSELIRVGVPSEAIEILPATVESTYDEASLFVRLAGERELRSLLLVTSAYHSRRALGTFEREIQRNDSPIEVGVQFSQSGRKTPPAYSWWLSGQGWKTVGAEYVKTIYYWMYY